MRKFPFIRRAISPQELPAILLRGESLKRLGRLRSQTVTRDELHGEGARIRDLIARVDADLGRLGERLHRLEQLLEK